MTPEQLKLFESAMNVIARFYELPIRTRVNIAEANPEFKEAITRLDKACIPFKPEHRNNTLFLIADAGINQRLKTE